MTHLEPQGRKQFPKSENSGLHKKFLKLLSEGEMRSPALIPHGSNYTFLVAVEDASGACCEAIYKPQAGERPLWDFPRGTLYKREYATYLVSQALGWPSVPPTVVRVGSHGVGSLQLFIQSQPGVNYFNLVEKHRDEFCRIALFDLLINNADRKAGHCLLGQDGHIWVIDHGLTFHSVFKLRTVIWDFCGQPIPEALLEEVEGFLARLSSKDGLARELEPWLEKGEIDAMAARGRLLLDKPVFPQLDPHSNVPWPWF